MYVIWSGWLIDWIPTQFKYSVHNRVRCSRCRWFQDIERALKGHTVYQKITLCPQWEFRLASEREEGRCKICRCTNTGEPPKLWVEIGGHTETVVFITHSLGRVMERLSVPWRIQEFSKRFKSLLVVRWSPYWLSPSIEISLGMSLLPSTSRYWIKILK